MRIQNRPRAKNTKTAKPADVKVKTAAPVTKDFPDELEKYHREKLPGDIEQLLKKLDETGRRLANSFSVYELKNYKDTLKDFLRQTQGQLYQLKEETARTRQGKTKVLQIIKKVESELEELSSLVLRQQKNQVALLSKLDQIRGLLVDLYS
ncbi:MAG: YaaR family protein [Peptococcaceae bacterium]|jgi:uncharacterized protein YaaR (DUF327 family)|nr:YaaR family protein [Peptococcaceae bacterium]MDH7525175.1 YaaR family protein [Peptococcaceae bacterium]